MPKPMKSNSKQDESAVKYPRRTQKKLETRRRIIKETAKLVSSVDLSQLTMAAVAEAADVHVTTLFTHFANKRDLLYALSEPGIAQLRERVAQNLGKTPFFEFYHQLWDEFLEVLLSEADTKASELMLWRTEIELVPAWLVFENNQLRLFATYIEKDLKVSKTQAGLIAGMLVASNIFTLDEWIRKPGDTDIGLAIRENILEAQKIVAQSFPNRGDK